MGDLQEDLEKYLHQVQDGETLTLYDGDRPIAEIRPIAYRGEGKGLRPFGLAKGQFTVPDDFDDPLPEEILRLFEGE